MCLHFHFRENCEMETITFRNRYCKIHKINCEHGKRKSYCKDCGGSQICEHKKDKRYCKDCRIKKINQKNILEPELWILPPPILVKIEPIE